MICKLRKIKFITSGILLAGMALGFQTIHAQDLKKVGTAAASFLRIPVGARGAALGGAVAATATDATAMFWNPAGIAHIEKYTVLVDYSAWLPGIDFNYIGVVVPTAGLGTIGVNVTSLATEDMAITTVEDPEGTGASFSASSIAVGVAYAKNLTDKFSIGANFKYINESIWNSNASTLAFDIGTLYTTPFDGIRLGVNIANFGSPLQMQGDDLNISADLDPSVNGDNQSLVARLATDQFETPLIMRVGLAWDALKEGTSRLTLSADGLNPNDNSQSVNMGAELGLMQDLLILRGGYNEMFLDNPEKGFALGGGINWTMQNGLKFTADFAYQQFEHLPSVNRFTVAIGF